MGQDRHWAIAIVLIWTSQIILGAIAYWQFELGLVSTALSVALLLVALWRLRDGLPSKSALTASLILISAITLSALQLVPLPPSIWTSFPGREFVVNTLSATAQTPGWMSLSLAPMETINYLIYSIPAIALFFAGLSLDPKSRRTVFLAVISIAVLATLLGLAQKADPRSVTLQILGGPTGLGFFANKNFQGALLYSSIPLMAALSLDAISKTKMHPLITALFAIAFLAIILIGIGSTSSRAAILLAMTAVVLTALMLWRREINDDRKLRFGIKFLAFAVVLFIAAQFGLAGISRLAEIDKLGDGRNVMAATSLVAIREYFPFGSGFGSFVPIYAMHELPDTMLTGYVNHAHNDWLELVLEGGAPMVLLIAAFLIWFGVASFKAWRERAGGIGNFSVRASAIVILLLAFHSFSDYPLRTRALMGLFALCCGFLAYGPEPRVKRQFRKPVPVSRPEARPTTQTSAPTSNEPARGPYFVRKPNPSVKSET